MNTKYRKPPFISIGFINLREGFRRAYPETAGLISHGAYNRNRNSASKQATAVLTKIRFAFTSFKSSFKTS